MQSITIQKQPGADYKRPIKLYNVCRNGEIVGTLQTWGREWDVFDTRLNKVTSHTTIRAAVRVAGRVL